MLLIIEKRQLQGKLILVFVLLLHKMKAGPSQGVNGLHHSIWKIFKVILSPNTDLLRNIRKRIYSNRRTNDKLI